MNIQNLNIPAEDLRKLLGACSGDAALLYLCLRSGSTPEEAAKQLNFTPTRYSCACATLRQLGLWIEESRTPILPGERPAYTEKDVIEAMDHSSDFRLLYGEVQRLLGRSLSTEELKIILSFVHYLGLPTEVISVLVSYCKDRSRQRGNSRNPSLRTIEKEAYRWAEEGIETLEAAAAYIHAQNVRASRLSQLMNTLQIRGRSLTQAEERYALSWLDMGFDMDVIAMAYERTCLNTGGMNWPYLNKILQRWNEAGMKTVEQIRSGDRKPANQSGPRQLDADELAAIARIMQEV